MRRDIAGGVGNTSVAGGSRRASQQRGMDSHGVAESGSRGISSGGTFRLDAHSWIRETDRIGSDRIGSASREHDGNVGRGIDRTVIRTTTNQTRNASAESVRPGLELLRENKETRRSRLGLDWGARRRAMHESMRERIGLGTDGIGRSGVALPPRVAGMKAALARLAAASAPSIGPAMKAAKRRWLAYQAKEKRRRHEAANGRSWLRINRQAVHLASEKVGAWRRHSIGVGGQLDRVGLLSPSVYRGMDSQLGGSVTG